MIRQISQAAVARITATAGRGPRAAALANLGMLCMSGLSARQLARTLPDMIRAVLPTEPVGLFWCNDDGAMVDAWVEMPGFLSSAVLHSGEIWRQENPDAWPRFADNVRAGPVAGVLLPFQNEHFYSSDFYRGSYASIGVRHVLDAVVHDGTRPFGCFLIMRSAAAGSFSQTDIALARAVADLVLPTFLADGHRPPATRRFPGGVAIAGPDNRLSFCNRAAHQSLWTLARAGDQPMSDDVDDDVETLYARFCIDGAARARAGHNHEERYLTSWGDFAVRFDRTDDGNVVTSFDQLQPFACNAAARITGLGLSKRRVITCWLLLAGLGRKEIAWLMQLSQETVNDHIDAVFAALNVSSTTDCIRHFAS